MSGVPERSIRGDDYRIDPETGCWIWIKKFSPRGYGEVDINGVNKRAHRWYYEQAKGPIPDGHLLHHRCHTRACVNPDHLEPLTKRGHAILHGESQVLGVFKHRDRWKARVQRNGKRVYLPGRFHSMEEAAQAIEEAGGYDG